MTLILYCWLFSIRFLWKFGIFRQFTFIDLQSVWLCDFYGHQRVHNVGKLWFYHWYRLYPLILCVYGKYLYIKFTIWAYHIRVDSLKLLPWNIAIVLKFRWFIFSQECPIAKLNYKVFLQDWEQAMKFGRIHRILHFVKFFVVLWDKASKYCENKVGYEAVG